MNDRCIYSGAELDASMDTARAGVYISAICADFIRQSDQKQTFWLFIRKGT